MVSRRSPRLVRRGKRELADISPGRSLHPGQAKPGRLAVVSGAMWQAWALHATEEDLVKQQHNMWELWGDNRHCGKWVTPTLGSSSGLESHGGTAEGGEGRRSAAPAPEASQPAWNRSVEQPHCVTRYNQVWTFLFLLHCDQLNLQQGHWKKSQNWIKLWIIYY